jgi:prepilin-type processing-associated H-X9-DG protein
MTISNSPRRGASNAVGVLALLVALAALFFALCTDPMKPGFALRMPFSSGMSGYDFETPAGAYKAQMEIEMNMDIRAMMEFEKRMRMKDKDTKERLDTLKVAKESEYKGKKNDEEVEYKILFVEYKNKGKDRKEVVVMQKDKDSSLWKRSYVSEFEVETTNEPLAKEMKDWGEGFKSAVEERREAVARVKAQNNLKQIGMAIHNYASANNGDALMIYATGKNGERVRAQFGPKGEPIYDPKPLLSWRVALLPYIEQAPLYQQFKFDEPWDSEHNKKLVDKMPAIYASLTKPGKPGMTHLQQVIGPQCMTPGRFNIGNIPDGASNTIAVVEAAEPVIWTKPDDVYFPQQDLDKPPADLKKKFGGQFPNGFNVLMFDGSARFVSSSVSDRTLWNLLRPADGNAIEGDW